MLTNDDILRVWKDNMRNAPHVKPKGMPLPMYTMIVQMQNARLGRLMSPGKSPTRAGSGGTSAAQTHNTIADAKEIYVATIEAFMNEELKKTN